MKKNNCICIMIIFLFVFWVTSSMSVFEVNASNINYTISYYTVVTGSSQIKCEGDLNPQYLTRYNKTFFVDITDPIITSELENFKQESLKQISDTNPNSAISDRTFIDGYVYPIPAESVDDYFRFFELPINFDGTKVIVKDDLPFTVIGDGNGNLSMTVLADFTGLKKKTIIIPTEKTHTIKEEMVRKDYDVYYHIPNSATDFLPGGRSDFYNAQSLEEALEFCSKNADLNKEIRISVTQNYRVDIEAYASRMTIMNITYGNSSKNITDNSSNNTKQEVTVKQEISTNDTKQSVNNNSSQNNEQTREDAVDENKIFKENEDVQNSNDKSVDNIDVKEKNDKKTSEKEHKSKNNIVTFFVLCVVITGGLFTLIKIIKKRR